MKKMSDLEYHGLKMRIYLPLTKEDYQNQWNIARTVYMQMVAIDQRMGIS